MAATRRPAWLPLLAVAAVLTMVSAGASNAATRTVLAVQSRTYELVSRVENLTGTERVASSKTETTFSLQASILFTKDSARISPQAQHKINEIAQEIARANPAKPVEIRGYTDNLGSAEHGLELSESRANAVKELLERNTALRRTHFTANGLGEVDPIADNRQESGRQRNRRVTITVPTR
ncbi:OmpA family protein [Streptomyces sp. NPDC001941]|uniref:OmpA family protein n=1 Tax=Streptomyces sp. NPDC001941 TaxID=3154659 RepID=UPI003323CBD2